MNRIPVVLCILLLSCSQPAKKERIFFSEKGREVPEFNADTAYAFIETQLENGPRVPNTAAHTLTRDYLASTLGKYAGKNMVFVQEFEMEGYSETLKLSNIIAAFNPGATDRIMLSAHWDTRPRADLAADRKDEAPDGADDGASGVAVLLELARQFSRHELPVGVDIVLFDGEDYGNEGDLSKYFLGSRYWSEHPPVPGYKPRFGILLDMVGAKNATFPRETHSDFYAPDVMNEIWAIAAQKGWSALFPDEKGSGVMDDHYIVSNITKIPMVDIINHSKASVNNSVFPAHWHTHDDNISIISKETLHSVGSILLELIYNRL